MTAAGIPNAYHPKSVITVTVITGDDYVITIDYGVDYG